jgi:hypothetical protein
MKLSIDQLTSKSTAPSRLTLLEVKSKRFCDATDNLGNSTVVTPEVHCLSCYLVLQVNVTTRQWWNQSTLSSANTAIVSLINGFRYGTQS